MLPLEQVSGDLVDPFIRALRRQDGGDQEFQGIGVMEGTLSVRISLMQPAKDLGDAR
jgi:hypothetical protein